MVQLHILPELLPPLYLLTVVVLGATLFSIFFPRRPERPREEPAEPRRGIYILAGRLCVMAIAFTLAIAGFAASETFGAGASNMEYTVYRFAMWVGVMWSTVMGLLVIYQLLVEGDE